MNEKKEKLEKWLDDMIELHRQTWKNHKFDEKIHLTHTSQFIFVSNVAHIAEILGCVVTFEPVSDHSSYARVIYKGVSFLEYVS